MFSTSSLHQSQIGTPMQRSRSSWMIVSLRMPAIIKKSACQATGSASICASPVAPLVSIKQALAARGRRSPADSPKASGSHPLRTFPTHCSPRGRRLGAHRGAAGSSFRRTAPSRRTTVRQQKGRRRTWFRSALAPSLAFVLSSALPNAAWSSLRFSKRRSLHARRVTSMRR